MSKVPNPIMDSSNLLTLISSDESLHLALLQSFTQAPSPNPPGNTVAAAAVISSYLSKHSISYTTIAPVPTSPNILAEFTCGASGPRLILNGHIDVFPAGDAKDWPRDPWSGEIRGGSLYGRGTVDMKAGTAASVIAFRYLYEHREHLKGSVLLCAVSDEETGGEWGSKFLLQNEKMRGDCMISAEPGGLNTIRFAEKGTLRLTFTVRTQGAHGAYPHRSKSATRIAAALIEDLAIVETLVPDISGDLEEYMQRQEVRDAVDEAMGSGAADLVLKATLNIGVIEGGLKVNMIPAKCVFQADIRLPIGLDRSQVLATIEKVLKNYPEVAIEIQEAASNPSNSCDYKYPMVDMLAKNAERITGKRPVAVPGLGATDCKFYRYESVPAYVFGVSPEGQATVDESVSVEEFSAVVKTHALAAWEYLGGAM